MLLWTALFHFQELIPSLHNDTGALNVCFWNIFVQRESVIPVMYFFSLNV